MSAFQHILEVGKEVQCSDVWIDPDGVSRAIFRKIIDCGPLPNATTKNVAHTITGIEVGVKGHAKLTEFWGSDGTTVIVGGPDVAIRFTATNIVLIATANLSTFTKSYVGIEYVKTLS